MLIIAVQPALAQKGKLVGYVNDAISAEPLPGAYVIVEGLNKGTSTGADGDYSLKLDPGSYQIRYQYISYKDSVISVTIVPGEETIVDMLLLPDVIMGEEIVVDAGRLAKRVRELSRLRAQQKKGLHSYKAKVYKLAILNSTEDKNGLPDTSSMKPVAFAERIATINFVKPDRYSETITARRASENFFSEYDFFSTGGSPLDLNSNKVSLSILSEDVTVVGPISVNARKYYDFEDQDAGKGWPEGTVELTVIPKFDNRPLFEGKVWLDDTKNAILGIDVRLNKYADTNTGLFKVTNLRYQQWYTKVDDFWLPEKTELTGIVSVLGSPKKIFYKDVWTWSEHTVNTTGLVAVDIPLSGEVLHEDVDSKPEAFWKNVTLRDGNENAELLEEAENYREKRVSVKVGMGLMRAVFRVPYQMERFYITNFDDLYRFNRVEGHFTGIGLRTPVHADHDYRLVGGYAFGEERFRYRIKALQYIPKTPVAVDAEYKRHIYLQYQDYEYNRTPIDFFEARQTMSSLILGIANRNYFEREGLEAGLRFRFGVESFLRVQYVDEHQRRLQSTTDYNVLGRQIDSLRYPNNNLVYPAQNGNASGLLIQLHHDTRKYMRYQFLRDYNVRAFGWLADVLYERGEEAWGSDFVYNRYRAALKFNWPVFSTHFIQTDIIFGASDAGTPGQRLFTFNGFVLDDYVRERPFVAVPFTEPVGHRISLVKLKYRFGSSMTRKVPVEFIRKSGIRTAFFLTAGVVDDTASLEPLVPYSGSEPQVEIGFAAFRILGMFYVEFSKRVIGEYGNSVGFQFLF